MSVSAAELWPCNNLADACLAHPASGPTLTLEEHCAKVEHAFTEARKAAPNWTYIYSELEHMP